jgi:nitric oxide reductase activation protein
VRSANSVFSRAKAGNFEDEPAQSAGYKYPEWNVYKHQYRLDWCTVHESIPEMKHAVSQTCVDSRLRRPLARLGVGLQHCHRQAQGDDIDIDAAVEARVEALAGSSPDEAVYIDTMRRRRDLGVLVLLDVSGSTAEPGTVGRTVHEQQRATAAALVDALHHLGDRVALYAFASQGRSSVNVIPIKRFDSQLDASVMNRLYGLAPGAYSRLGAAIRHGAAVLEEKSGTTRRLLVVISDGLAYDLGYERDYGAADARRALAEARRRGTGCLCLTVGASTDVAELRRVFGSAAHAAIARPEKLAETVGPLFRSALKSAEARRRRSQRKTRAKGLSARNPGFQAVSLHQEADRATDPPATNSRLPRHSRQ